MKSGSLKGNGGCNLMQMMRALLFLPLIALALVPAVAQSPTPGSSVAVTDAARDRIDIIWKAGPQAAWFSQSFLAEVPFSQVVQTLEQIRSQLGPYQDTVGAKGTYISRFARGTQEVQMHLDSTNRIDRMFLPPPKIRVSSLEDGLARVRSLPGRVSYLVIDGGSAAAAANADEPMAVGSSFKLAILAGLSDEIATGRRRWADVIPLDQRWKSLPTGVLQTWPAQTPLSLASYALEMISISDNTAADALASIIGPHAIQRYAIRNEPFLTTRELFTLRSSDNAPLLVRWVSAGTPQQRLAMKKELDRTPLPSIASISPAVADLSVEWLYSVRELCLLMSRVDRLDLMTVNPGFADPRDFRRVAFKGGSEPGVINATTSVVTRGGHHVCISVTVNDTKQAVDVDRFGLAYRSVLDVIAGF